jgi:hypothetical protein
MAAPGVVVPQPLPWQRRLTAVLAAGLFRLFLKTWRVRWLDSVEHPISDGPVIFCVWHNRFAAALACYDKIAQARWPAKGVAAMISASRDGSLVANVAERFGVFTIRGSSSRRGAQALLEATRKGDDHNIVMLPDGPRGPAYEIKKGVIQLAQLTGRPIIPISVFTPWKISLPSWDRFQIPLPFARFEASYAEPVWVPRHATNADREQLRARLELLMRSITRD